MPEKYRRKEHNVIGDGKFHPIVPSLHPMSSRQMFDYIISEIQIQERSEQIYASHVKNIAEL